MGAEFQVAPDDVLFLQDLGFPIPCVGHHPDRAALEAELAKVAGGELEAMVRDERWQTREFSEPVRREKAFCHAVQRRE